MSDEDPDNIEKSMKLSTEDRKKIFGETIPETTSAVALTHEEVHAIIPPLDMDSIDKRYIDVSETQISDADNNDEIIEKEILVKTVDIEQSMKLSVKELDEINDRWNGYVPEPDPTLKKKKDRGIDMDF